MGVCDPFRQQLRRTLIENFYSEFQSSDTDKYFLSIGKISEWTGTTGSANDDFPPRNVDSVYSDTEFWRGVLAYKRIYPENVSLVVKRYDWEPGSVYTPYRDNIDLFDDENPSVFYVLVDEERVYKCIDNNFGAASTIAPTHTDYQIRTLSDGYKWKFLYQIPESKRKFLTKGFSNKTGYMPVEYVERLLEDDDRELQWNVQQASVDGSIDFIELNETIRSQVVSSKVVFPSSENQIASATAAGSSAVIIAGPNLVYSNDYYNGMVIKIDSGLGEGQQRVISDYSAGSNTATVTLSTPLDIGVTGGSGSDVSIYSILPQVRIYGDGRSYNNALNSQSTKAEVTVTFQDNSITGARLLDGIEVIDSGQDYTFADVIIVSGLTGYNGMTADLSNLARAVISPVGGHGSNPVKELGCSSLMVVTDFSQDEDGKLTIDNEFRQFGLVKNPELYYPQKRLTLYNTGPSSMYAAGNTVTSSTGNGIGEVVSWYGGITGVTGTSELVLTLLSGSFPVGATLSTSGYTIMESESKTVAGTEGRNLKKISLIPLGTAGTTFDPNGGDFTRGYLAVSTGSTADGVYQTYSIGKVYRWQPDDATNLSGKLYLENYHGTFNDYEYVGQITKGLTGFESGIGQITDASETEEDNLDVYTQTFKMQLSHNGVDTFTSTSFGLDDLVTSISGSTEVARGYIVDWTPATGGTQGTLWLNGVWGIFATGHYIEYASGTTGAIINSILDTPDVRYHTGEILHVQNIRPVERSIEQREEIKFIVEF
jgi:hypothetical protein